MLRVYNTISREKEEFIPLYGNNVGMYVCGPTVYGFPHLGHAKSYISFDIVYRYLKFKGYNVKYVQNITDVGHLVGDADNRVVGIISETDIIKKEKHVAAPEFITFLQGVIYLEDFKKMEKDIQDIAAVQVKDLMSKEVIKVYEDDTFDDVANIMIKKSVNRVPVVDKDNKIKGIICRYDIIKSMYE